MSWPSMSKGDACVSLCPPSSHGNLEFYGFEYWVKRGDKYIKCISIIFRALAAATPAPEAPREEKLPPQVQCRLCDKPIQPKKEEYFEVGPLPCPPLNKLFQYSCGPDYNKEVCVFNTHKMCLTAWYKANRGATNKSEWKVSISLPLFIHILLLRIPSVSLEIAKRTCSAST